jgi:hypothetical protein
MASFFTLNDKNMLAATAETRDGCAQVDRQNLEGATRLLSAVEYFTDYRGKLQNLNTFLRAVDHFTK